MADPAETEVLVASIRSLRTSGEYYDMIITCGSDSYKVHKNIVCTRAEFFAHALKFRGQESESGTINLPEDEPEIIKLLIQSLYDGRYDHAPLCKDSTSDTTTLIDKQPPKFGPNDESLTSIVPHKCYFETDSSGIIYSYCQTALCEHHICEPHGSGQCCEHFICLECVDEVTLKGGADQTLIHAKMYEIADKCDVIGLKDLSKEKFRRACAAFWDEEDFGTAAHHALLTTPENDKGLRDIIKTTISNNFHIVHDACIEALLTEFSGRAVELLQEKHPRW